MRLFAALVVFLTVFLVGCGHRQQMVPLAQYYDLEDDNIYLRDELSRARRELARLKSLTDMEAERRYGRLGFLRQKEDEDPGADADGGSGL